MLFSAKALLIINYSKIYVRIEYCKKFQEVKFPLTLRGGRERNHDSENRYCRPERNR
ncbi:hypothetical protein FHS14_005531 [Paenibacillus baekrokdamisoli]|nr:hypothetical protein [Paenibacillus baekrokdamisoli]